MAEQVTNQTAGAKKRPTFLTVLCILTFIGSGLGLLFSIIGVVAAGALSGIASKLPMSTVADVGMGKSIAILVMYAGSLFGAIQMWNLKKLGFFIYAIANIILLVLNFGIWGLVFTAAFIVMYAVNLKYME